MDYEKRYKEAIEAMKDCIPDKDGYVCVRPCDIFPELAESEDEKIRKALIRTLNSDAAENVLNSYGINKFAALAWLEKQVKETAISQHENKTCKENDDSLTCENEKIRGAIIDHLKDNNLTEWAAWLEKRKDYVSPQMVADAYLRGCNDTEKKWLEKQGQSFPILSNSSKTGKKWAEEDDKRQISITEYLNELYDDNRFSLDELTDLETWLKQLKQRIKQ